MALMPTTPSRLQKGWMLDVRESLGHLWTLLPQRGIQMTSREYEWGMDNLCMKAD